MLLIRLVALRHLLWSPLRTLLTVFGIAIAVAAVVAISSANRAILESFRGTVNHLSGKVDLEVGDGDGALPDALLEKVKDVPGVSHASPIVQATARHGKSGDTVLVLGVDLTGDDYFRDYQPMEGELDPIEFLNCANCVLLGSSFAARHGLKKGDSLLLLTPQGERELKIKELLKDEGPVKAFGGNVAIMYLDAAQLIFEREGRIDRIDLALDPSKDFDTTRDLIRAAVGEGVPVDRPARRGERTEAMMTRFQSVVQLASTVAVFVAMFMIYNTVGIAVAQRRREIGMLRALGVTQAEVQWLFVGEAVLLGLVGSVCGVAIGQALSRGVLGAINQTITSLYVELNVSTAHVTPSQILLGVGVGVGATALSAYLPAAEAAHTPPALSVARGMRGTPPAFRWQTGVGVALALYGLSLIVAPIRVTGPVPWPGQIGLLLALAATAALSPVVLQIVGRTARRPMAALFGVPGQLAADNLLRQGSRAVVTVAALLVGIGLATGISTIVNGFQTSVTHWIEQSVPADLFVTGAGETGVNARVRLPESLALGIDALPGGKGTVERVAVRKLNYEDLRLSVITIEFELRLKRAKLIMLDGDAPKSAADMTRERVVMVSENFAYRKKLVPGGVLRLSSPTGFHDYRIQGVYVDYTSDQGTVLMDRHWYSRDFLDDSIDTLELYLDDPAQVAPLQRAIAASFGAKYKLLIRTNGEFRQDVQGIVDQSFRATSALSMLSVIVALLGVINTLFAAVLDRTKELGVLRAVGTTGSQVVKMIVYEAMLLALCAAVLGLLAGAVVGLLFVRFVNVAGTGWHIGFYPPWAYQAQLLLLAVGASAAAGVWPAYRATRVKVTQALAYE